MAESWTQLQRMFVKLSNQSVISGCENNRCSALGILDTTTSLSQREATELKAEVGAASRNRIRIIHSYKSITYRACCAEIDHT